HKPKSDWSDIGWLPCSDVQVLVNDPLGHFQRLNLSLALNTVALDKLSYGQARKALRASGIGFAQHCSLSRTRSGDVNAAHAAPACSGDTPKISGRRSWREIPVKRSTSRTRSAGT